MSNTKKEEEIDLGQLFLIIGRGFSKVFQFIGNILNSIFHGFILLLLFIKNNLKKLVLGALIGGIIGGIYQYGIKEQSFESSMTVQPNFGSAVQLYKNIDYYESLVKQKDIERLAESLKLSTKEAESITSITVEPYSNENQILISYKDFISDLDSNTVKLIDYDTYAKEQPVESFKYHIVTVEASDKYIFVKLEEPIINSIISNAYYDKVKATSYLNLSSRKKALEDSMVELDSLRDLYKKVMVAESLKENSGTNLYMANAESKTKEVVVFDKYMLMNQDLIEVNKQLTEENEVINVVSSFNSVGKKVRGWYNNYAVLGVVTGLLLVLIITLISRLNDYLTIKNSQI